MMDRWAHPVCEDKVRKKVLDLLLSCYLLNPSIALLLRLYQILSAPYSN